MHRAVRACVLTLGAFPLACSDPSRDPKVDDAAADAAGPPPDVATTADSGSGADGAADGAADCPALTPASEWPTGTTLGPNDPSGIYAVGTSETWTAAASPYRLSVNVDIAGTLTLEPCAVVVMSSGRFAVQAGGRLIGRGSSGLPILIAGTPPADAKVGFRGITATTSSATAEPISLGYATIEGSAGGDYVIDANGVVNLENVTLRNNFAGGVRLGPSGRFSSESAALTVTGGGIGNDENQFAATALPVLVQDPSYADTIPTGQYAGNAQNLIGLGVIGSGGNEITRTTSIHNRGVPYVLLARLTVAGEPTAVLTIEPGVKLLGQTSSSYLKIFESRDGMSGGLLAEGTAAAPIVMEGRLAEPGSWGGVQVVGKPATLKLAYVHLRHTGMSGGTAYGTCPDDTSVRGDGAAVGIIGKDAGPFMTNVTISNYTGVGILRAWTSSASMGQPDTNYLDAAMGNKVEGGSCGMTSPVLPGGGCPSVSTCL